MGGGREQAGHRPGWQLLYIWAYRKKHREGGGPAREHSLKGEVAGRGPHSRLVPKSCRKKVKM